MNTAQHRRAAITWSLIAEPGDALGHLVAKSLGAAAALEHLRHSSDDEILEALQQAVPEGEGPLDEGAYTSSTSTGLLPRITEGRRRWCARWAQVDPDSVHDLAQQQGIRVLVPGDPQWPTVLDVLGRATPHCLWAHGPGNPSDLGVDDAVAIVGARSATDYGVEVAGSFARQLAVAGCTIVSGGAYGIDAAAHYGALSAGRGATVAVLAGGLDSLYPRANTEMLQRIRARHVLLSEAPPGTAPTRWRFLSRNRLIAALTGATVVVEAALRSGALATARRALDIKRPVGIVPGSIHSAASAGCHDFVRQNPDVLLVTDADEIRGLLAGGLAVDGRGHAVQDALDLLSPRDRRVLDALPPRGGSVSVRRVGQEINWADDEVESALGRLEVLGMVASSGDRVRRARAAG